jgi:hypothetical protein
MFDYSLYVAATGRVDFGFYGFSTRRAAKFEFRGGLWRAEVEAIRSRRITNDVSIPARANYRTRSDTSLTLECDLWTH